LSLGRGGTVLIRIDRSNPLGQNLDALGTFNLTVRILCAKQMGKWGSNSAYGRPCFVSKGKVLSFKQQCTADTVGSQHGRFGSVSFFRVCSDISDSSYCALGAKV
jgi:hypothetical protein